MKVVAVQMTLAVALLAAVVGTGITLVTSAHESRRLFQELEELRREEHRLLDDWSALQLEVETLERHDRIDRIAREELGFTDPGPSLEYVERPQ